MCEVYRYIPKNNGRILRLYDVRSSPRTEQLQDSVHSLFQMVGITKLVALVRKWYWISQFDRLMRFLLLDSERLRARFRVPIAGFTVFSAETRRNRRIDGREVKPKTINRKTRLAPEKQIKWNFLHCRTVRIVENQLHNR